MRSVHRLGRHGALHDEKVGTPVTEREDKAQAEDEAEPAHAHRIVRRVRQVLPRMGPRAGREALRRGDGRQPRLHRLPAADVAQRQVDQRGETEHDHEELQHLVVNRRGEAAEEDVDEHDGRRDQDAGVIIPAHQRLQQTCQRVQRDAGGKHGHDRERDRVQSARFFVEAQLQVLRHGARLGAVVKRHHEHSQEDHRRDRADPIKVARHDAVLRARCGHADDLLRTEIGRKERQPGDPGGNRPAREKEGRAALHPALEHDADAENETEVDAQDEVIDGGQVDPGHDRRS